MDIPTTSVFATASTSAEDVQALCAWACSFGPGATVTPGHLLPDLPYGQQPTKIGYNRGYLIAKRAWAEAFRPEVLVDLRTLEAAAREKYGMDFEYMLHVLGPVVAGLRFGQTHPGIEVSWGDISVLTGTPESRCRKAFRTPGLGHGLKDLGLRIGRGGRHAYDDETLYQENRIREGARIDINFRGRPAPEQLLNYQPPEAEAPKRTVRKAAKSA